MEDLEESSLKKSCTSSDKLHQFDGLRQSRVEYVFINPDTNMPYSDIKKSFHSVLKKAGITDFRFYNFRHTTATRMRRIWRLI